MCQRVKRHLQKRLVELRDHLARTSRQIAMSQNGMESIEFARQYTTIEARISEIEGVIFVMDAPPARVIQVEEAVKRAMVANPDLPDNEMRWIDQSPKALEAAAQILYGDDRPADPAELTQSSKHTRPQNDH